MVEYARLWLQVVAGILWVGALAMSFSGLARGIGHATMFAGYAFMMGAWFATGKVPTRHRGQLNVRNTVLLLDGLQFSNGPISR